MTTDSDYLFELQAEMLSALSHPRRLMILKILGTEEKTVGEIAQQVGIEMPNVSQHLRIMKAHGLVTSRRDGQAVYYRAGTPLIAECCELVRKAIVDDLEKKRMMIRKKNY